MPSYSLSAHVELVVADGTYHIHLPTRKPNDTVKYHPLPGEFIAVYIRPGNQKFIGVPLRPHEEPMFVHHFVRMYARCSELPWVMCVEEQELEHKAGVLFGQMCQQAHRVWSTSRSLKNMANMLEEPVSRGFIALNRSDSAESYTIHL